MNHDQLLEDALRRHSLQEIIRMADILLDRSSEELNNKNSKEHSNFAAYVMAVLLDIKLQAKEGLEGKL
ncbi:hypothetical protein EBU95_03850 [bacterium]|nr:hypothetical protein [bacterium]